MNSRFEGWYFKQTSPGGTIAFIPARHIDHNGVASASVQIVTQTGGYYIEYPYDSFWMDRSRTCIAVGDNVFSPKGMHVQVDCDGISAHGNLRFGQTHPLQHDIMGPFRYFSGLECKHRIYSLSHETAGELTVNGDTLCFDGGTGYMEGDYGRSFPKQYLWTQCHFEDDGPGSLMLSAAELPVFGKRITGVICAMLWRGKTYRMASYLGARIERLDHDGIAISQGRWELEAVLLSGNETELKAPGNGGMERRIKEHLCCRAWYRLKKNGATQLEFVSEQASFEQEFHRHICNGRRAY